MAPPQRRRRYRRSRPPRSSGRPHRRVARVRSRQSDSRVVDARHDRRRRADDARRVQRHRPRLRPHGDGRHAVPRPGGAYSGSAGGVVRRPNAQLRRAGSGCRGHRSASRRGRHRPPRTRRHRGAPRSRHARRRHRHARPRSCLRAARSDVPDRPPAVHGRGLRNQGPARHRCHGLAAGRTWHHGGRSGRRANRRRGDREPDRRPRSSRPRLRDLHVGLHGQAQGRHARTPRGDELLRGHGPRHRCRPIRSVARGHQPLVRHLGARAALDGHPRLPRRHQGRPRDPDRNTGT